MKIRVNLSIRKRIYWSFTLLVFLFMINAVSTFVTLNNNKKLSNRLSKVLDPSIETTDEFKKMLVESEMYTTNWVFLRSKREDKESLIKLHNSDYQVIKSRLTIYSSLWINKNWVDSLNKVFAGFEELLVIEKSIMSSLKEFGDYNDPVIKLEAERKVEEEVLPRTTSLTNSLNVIYSNGIRIRVEENEKLERSALQLKMQIIISALIIICVGIILAIYMTKIIVRPINKIRHIVNDLGKGITRKIGDNGNNNEIGKMIQSVNNLSKKLHATATFAHEVGARNFDMPFSPLSDDDALGKALMAMRDNLRTSEAGIEMKNKELERKNKELEQFAYVASHDLQEPIRTTSSFVELLQKEYKGKLDERGDKYLTYIVQASDRMRVLIKDLLEYSRIGTKMEFKQVDCNILLNEVLDDLGTAIAEAGAEISSVHLPVINGYPTEIKQLFQNLILNAIKFTKKNILPQVLISVTKSQGYWEFAINDNGIGIPEEHNERIFVIFQRLHNRNAYKGSGIGLSHCKKIVELHKGRIWVKSTPGNGSTFYFTLSASPGSVLQGKVRQADIEENIFI